MLILQFGRTGQLAREMLDRAPARGAEIRALGREAADLTDPEAVERAVLDAPEGVSAVVNAAAYTAVDQAESDEEKARLVNAAAPAAMARACAARGIPLIHVSTDYVFNGSGTGPYAEDAPVDPVSAYGRTKAEGEAAIRDALERHVILRTAWVYSPYGKNFVKTMLRAGAQRDELTVVDDQHGCPTSAGDLAEAILDIAQAIADGNEAWGTYHFANEGETTWRGFADEIFTQAESWSRARPRVTPVTTDQYPTPARRPANSVLSTGALTAAFGIEPRPWQAALGDVLDRLSREGDHSAT